MSAAPEVIARVDAFAAQLAEQAAVYREVLSLTDRQQEALAAQDLAGFNALLGEKATRMEQLAALDDAMAENRAQWEAHREAIDDAQRDRLRTTVDNIRGLLQRLIDVESECEQRLQDVQAGVARDLRQLGQGQRAMRSYGAGPPPPKRGRLDVGG